LHDVVVAVVGASAAIAGFTLVFLGILVTSYQSLLGKASERTLERFKATAIGSLAVFIIGLMSLTLGMSWLVADGGRCFYIVVLVVFFAGVAAFALDALYVTFYVLLRG
jgi:hypothetical protein